MTPEAKLASMGLALPEVPKPVANYVPFKITATRSTSRARARGATTARYATGKVGRDVTVEQAYEHAKLVGLGLLAAAKAGGRRSRQGSRC